MCCLIIRVVVWLEVLSIDGNAGRFARPSHDLNHLQHLFDRAPGIRSLLYANSQRVLDFFFFCKVNRKMTEFENFVLSSSYRLEFECTDLVKAILDSVKTFSVIPEKFPSGFFFRVKRHQQLKTVLSADGKNSFKSETMCAEEHKLIIPAHSVKIWFLSWKNIAASQMQVNVITRSTEDSVANCSHSLALQILPIIETMKLNPVDTSTQSGCYLQCSNHTRRRQGCRRLLWFCLSRARAKLALTAPT